MQNFNIFFFYLQVVDKHQNSTSVQNDEKSVRNWEDSPDKKDDDDDDTCSNRVSTAGISVNKFYSLKTVSQNNSSDGSHTDASHNPSHSKEPELKKTSTIELIYHDPPEGSPNRGSPRPNTVSSISNFGSSQKKIVNTARTTNNNSSPNSTPKTHKQSFSTSKTSPFNTSTLKLMR